MIRPLQQEIQASRPAAFGEFPLSRPIPLTQADATIATLPRLRAMAVRNLPMKLPASNHAGLFGFDLNDKAPLRRVG